MTAAGSLPSCFHTVRAPGAVAFARPEAMTWLRTRLAHPGGLHGAALEEAEELLEGRGPVPVVAAPADGSVPRVARPGDVGVPWRAAGRWAVRHYHRGGAVASLLADRYLRFGTPRPVREAAASEEVGRRGIATPAVVAGVTYPAGAIYRADLVTAYVPATRDLAALLFGRPVGELGREAPARSPAQNLDARLRALELAGGLVARMAAAGVRHPDLNAKNVLLRTPGERPSDRGPDVLLLDLDRCGFSGGDDAPSPLLERLERSLRKFERQVGTALTAPEWAALRRAAGIAS